MSLGAFDFVIPYRVRRNMKAVIEGMLTHCQLQVIHPIALNVRVEQLQQLSINW